MTTTVTLHKGHDVAYFTRGQGGGGCTGAMSYYTAAGEPPGQWAGKAAARLGLTGQVDPGVIERLYQQNIGPNGEVLARRRQSKAADQREDAAVSAYLAEHPFASAVELAEVRAAERAKDPHRVPYFDLTISAVKSVSVLHASYRVSARQARERGDDSRAAELDKRADDIEQALVDAAQAALEWLERHGTFTRTGHHSANTESGATVTAWSPACFCTTSPGMATPSFTCTCRSSTSSSEAITPTRSGAPWTRKPCISCGSRSPRSRTGWGKRGCPSSAMSWCPGWTGTAPKSAGSANKSWTCSHPGPGRSRPS